MTNLTNDFQYGFNIDQYEFYVVEKEVNNTFKKIVYAEVKGRYSQIAVAKITGNTIVIEGKDNSRKQIKNNDIFMETLEVADEKLYEVVETIANKKSWLLK